jgi:hypothetical protein
VLWALANLAGFGVEHFMESSKFETTRGLTIHHMSLLGSSHRLDGRSSHDILRLFESAEWLTFALVREPVRRMWSAWVSKILLRELRFTIACGRENWFPPVPDSADNVVRSFRLFVEAISGRRRAWPDRRWASQADLLAVHRLRYDVVGRVEGLPSVLAPVDEHLRAQGAGLLALGPENRSLVTFTPEVLDFPPRERLSTFTDLDRRAFGYDTVPPGAGEEPGDHWRAEVEARPPAIRAIIERNECIGDLVRLATRSRAS